MLIAAARTGDCVVVGQTLRRGVNNAPEFALTAVDAMGLTTAGVALGAKAWRSRRMATLATRVVDPAAHSVKLAVASPVGVCVGRRCPRGRALCFTAGTRVHTENGHVRIERLRVGDRIATTGTARSHEEGRVDATWKTIALEMERGPDDVVRIRLLRPRAWIVRAGATAGGAISLNLPEMGLDGTARVLAIDAAPRVAEGAGHLVLATFESEAKDVLELRFAGSKEVLEPTSRHRLYSLDRDGWIAAGKLRIGERLRTRSGDAVIASVDTKPGTHTVYNLEVATDHSYFVGDVGVLSHNQEPYEPEPRALTIEQARKRWPELFPGLEQASRRSATPFQMIHRDYAVSLLAMDGRYDAILDEVKAVLTSLDGDLARASRRRVELATKELDTLKTRVDDPLEVSLGQLVSQSPEIATDTSRTHELAHFFCAVS